MLHYVSLLSTVVFEKERELELKLTYQFQKRSKNRENILDTL